jgi:hypothetical protein
MTTESNSLFSVLLNKLGDLGFLFAAILQALVTQLVCLLSY